MVPNQEEKLLFHQHNLEYHKSIATMAKLNELHFELLPNPQYSPDLTPSGYYLFSNLKKCSPDIDMPPIQETIAVTEEYLF